MHTIAFFTTPATCWHRQNPHNCKSLTTNTLRVNLPWYSNIFKIYPIFSNLFEILPYCHIVRPVHTHSPPFFLPREEGETKRMWVIKWISLLWNFWQLLTDCEAQIMALMRMTLTFFLESEWPNAREYERGGKTGETWWLMGSGGLLKNCETQIMALMGWVTKRRRTPEGMTGDMMGSSGHTV